MFKLSLNIEIKGSKSWAFSAVNHCTIVQDINALTDTCEITMPKRVVWKSDEVFTDGNPPIKRGDKITVDMGYDDKLKRRFTGYIRSVGVQTPTIIKCEDSMFILKQKKITPKAFTNATLEDLMTYLLKGTGFDFKVIDKGIKLGNYRITKPTIAQELKELKDRYLLSAYFRNIDGKELLYVGLKYPFDHRNTVIFKHGHNIIDEDFEYRRAEDIKARVQAISFGTRNKKITIEVGDPDGDLIEIRIDGLTETELKQFAQQALDRYKKSGFKGSFETFGVPEIRTCDIARLIASDGSDGTYLIKKNEINYGMEGYRQDIELGTALNVNDG